MPDKQPDKFNLSVLYFGGINAGLAWRKLWLMLQKTVSWREENYELDLLT